MIDASRGGRVKQQPAWRPPADKALIQRPRELDIVLVPGGSLRHASRLPSANYCTGPDDARINYPVALSVLSQQIGWEGRPRNYLYCTGWDVKPRSIIPSLAAAAAVDCFL